MSRSPRVGYVLKVYPRFSETFIVNELLGHQTAGLGVEIFGLRTPREGRFHESVSRIEAPVRYFELPKLRSEELWNDLRRVGRSRPELWPTLAEAEGADAREIQQACLIAEAALERGIEHLHAHFATTATTVARLAARIAGITYSFTAHARDIFHESVDTALLERKLRDAAFVVTVSEFNVEFLRSTYGEAASGVTRIYNGLDLETFSYRSPEERPPLLLGVGRLVEKKGFSVLVDACRLLRDRGRSFRCEIIGEGKLEADLRRQIEEQGLSDVVTLLGPKPQQEVRNRLHQAAVFAAPCVVGNDGNRDGLPTVLLEAMSLGTPCVSTDVTGIPEILHHNATGLHVPQNDAPALAAACEMLLEDAALRVRLARGARRLMEERFDIHRNTEQMREHFGSARSGDAAVTLEAAAR